MIEPVDVTACFITQAHEQGYTFCSKCLEFIYTCTKHEWPRAGIETMWHLCEHYPLQRLVPIIDHNSISCWAEVSLRILLKSSERSHHKKIENYLLPVV